MHPLLRHDVTSARFGVRGDFTAFGNRVFGARVGDEENVGLGLSHGELGREELQVASGVLVVEDVDTLILVYVLIDAVGVAVLTVRLFVPQNAALRKGVHHRLAELLQGFQVVGLGVDEDVPSHGLGADQAVLGVVERLGDVASHYLVELGPKAHPGHHAVVAAGLVVRLLHLLHHLRDPGGAARHHAGIRLLLNPDPQK